ncbi:DUF2178 domain-containing protein [Natronomonas gomsonensis]|jgi:uncharacterized membrane protein|uniref:DUF2178 domain-containing protein n=1 Tax=Natronomonas gomsonensis TaxID=1046043 RepID=UPI0020CA99AA|nr:DUF2178 domain-containing protein [Natronomonas gomsonensis]MCY4731885.1 DUF2178 domain-containing protein [Natronomonas gomsonensis]
MNSTTTTRFDPTTYRRTTFGVTLLAALALAFGVVFEVPFVGIAVYALGLVAVFSLPAVTDVRLFDERDDAIARKAAGTTLTLFGWLSAIVYPSLVALSATGQFSWGPASTAVAFATAAVYAVYLLALGYHRYR